MAAITEGTVGGGATMAAPPPVPLGTHHGGSFRVYMQHKSAKLQVQVPDGRSTLFEGVRAYVNGYTRPSLDELRSLLAEHSGRVVQYWSKKSDITHVIAENLPATKIQDMLCVTGCLVGRWGPVRPVTRPPRAFAAAESPAIPLPL